MTLAAKFYPKKVAGLIGLAATADFGNSLYENLSIKNKNEIKKKGKTKYSSYGFSYTLTKKFFIEAKKNNILNKKFKFNKPLILIQGLKDEVVHPDMAKKIMGITSGKNVQILYLKSSDHRLSKPTDLLVINNAIGNVVSLI